MLGIVASPFLLTGCSQSGGGLAVTPAPVSAQAYSYTDQDRECLARAMFFESRRSSREGLVAVGTVVMNRLESDQHGDTVCEVVGQKGQFARGVMTRPMNSTALPDVQEAADAVLKGERHPKMKDAMFFHAEGLKFPYKNMHYVLVAGGNAFYEKRGRRKPPLPAEPETVVAAAPSEAETAVVVAANPGPEPFEVRSQGEVAGMPEPVMSFEASAEDADAIGALIVSQNRP